MVMLIVISFLLLPNLSSGCILCPNRIPPYPKPLDQFRIPSIQKLLDTSETIVALCQNNSSFESISESCSQDVSRLFCSLKDLVDSFKVKCAGPESPEQCHTCNEKSALQSAKSSWVKTWIDSFGKMPAGISDGNYHWLGDYEQCKSLQTSGAFDGRYCLVDFAVPDTVKTFECEHDDPLEVSLGACLPRSCSAEENTYLVEHVTELKVQIRCEPQPEWPISSIIFWVVIMVWLLVLLLATLLEWLQLSENDNSKGLIKALSIAHNARESLRTTRSSQHQFHAFQGIQVASVIFLVSGNVFYLMLPYTENISYAYDLSTHFFYQAIINYSFFVDGLLALGAVRLALRPSDNFKTIKGSLQLLFRRLIRVWPAYIFAILFISSIYIRLGEGPMWSHIDLPKRCQQNWWSNALFINNLLGIEHTCLDGAYVFALKTQLVTFAVILFYLEHIVGKRAITWTLLTCILLSIIYTFTLTMQNDLPITLIPMSNLKEIDAYTEFVNRIYMHPLGRFAPYMLGLLLARLYKNSNRSTLGQMRGSVEFFICVIGAFVTIWTPFYFHHVANTFMVAIYSSLHRILWAFIVICVVFSLNHVSKGNTLNAILGWRAFHPLSKLTYLVFLISEPVSLSLFASLHRPIYATSLSTILTCIGCVCVSYIIAFLIDIGVSRPIRNLLDMCIAPKRTTTP